jgi:hypothetical protein
MNVNTGAIQLTHLFSFWVGVLCSLKANVNLNGTIPAELGSLSSMEFIYFRSNPDLVGQIPDELFYPERLNSVRIFDCGLTGTIPTTIGVATALTVINLSTNFISGSIPTSMGKLVNLELFFADENQLNGTIPTEMGTLNTIRTVWLVNNRLEGTIPSEWSNMSNLRQLDLSDNDLMGGGSSICTLVSDGFLQTYSTDCLSQSIPPVPQELDCCCCSSCCADGDGCIFNDNVCEE